MENQISVHDRFMELIEDKNLNKKSFSEKVGVSYSTVYTMFDKGSGPSFDLLNKTAIKYPEVDLRWLVTGQGSMYKGGGKYSVPQESYEPDTNDPITVFKRKNGVPLIDLDELEDALEKPFKEWVRIPGLRDSQFVTRVPAGGFGEILRENEMIFCKEVRLDELVLNRPYLIVLDSQVQICNLKQGKAKEELILDLGTRDNLQFIKKTQVRRIFQVKAFVRSL